MVGNSLIFTRQTAEQNCILCTYWLSVAEEHSPHVIINELRRKKLDANRHKAEATFGDPKAMVAWEEYHSFINMAKAAATAGGRNAFYVDMHGHVSLTWSLL